jgi:hypothetical protein
MPITLEGIQEVQVRDTVSRREKRLKIVLDEVKVEEWGMVQIAHEDHKPSNYELTVMMFRERAMMKAVYKELAALHGTPK